MLSLIAAVVAVLLIGMGITLAETVLLAYPEEEKPGEDDPYSEKLEQFRENSRNIYETAEILRYALLAIGLFVIESYLISYLNSLGIPTDDYIKWLTIIVTSAVIALLFWLLSVYIPRGFGEGYPEKIVRFTYHILIVIDFTSKIFTPVLKSPVRRLLKLFKAEPNYSITLISEEHIRKLLDAGLEKGKLEEEEHEILENVLEFHDLTAYDVMIPRTEMAAVELTGNPQEDFKAIIRAGYNSVPIFEGSVDNITGVVNVKELMRSYIVNNDYRVERAVKPPHFVPETKHISEILKEMQLKGIRTAIVADEYGGTEGIIKLEDILGEIVGDITQKAPDAPAEISRLGDGSFIILGNVDIDDLNEILESEFPESEEYTTFAGFVSDITGKILNPGDTVEYQGYTIELTKRVKNKMAEFRLTKNSEKKSNEGNRI
ncbi:MAG: hemolysin family protein [Ignavibacteriales bacterium]|nr:MAG: HlyC/CorC family transporter [Ignavibacteriaceae bacterium]MBW7873097.1 HlyC/CorC family transporter [Ignavibacteria bacterium]MCZ2142740.1 hemolysin family protein [Ignavibacteriales bacterium]OQY77137.1 MAG: hypothetical protein B6D45_03075 [Ignavibacteriales bacterium UTCHB3]MBV6443834.1 hypothetical protein [Ignavibacteriaceae bacterium]